MARKRRNRGRNTGGTNMPEVPAGELKPGPIPAKGAKTDPPPFRGSRGRTPRVSGDSYSSGKGIDILNPGKVGNQPWLHPVPILHRAGTSGITEGTQVIRDQFANKQLVYSTYFRANMWQPSAAGTNHFLQQGTVTTDATVDGTLGSIITNLYSTITRQYMAVKGRVFPTFQTAAPAVGAVAVASYLQAYTEMFLMTRTLEGLLNIGNYNFASQLISGSAVQRMIQIRSAAQRLRQYPAPQMLCNILDMLCGPKAKNEDEPLFLTCLHSDQVNVLAQDPSVLATLDSIITRINNIATLITTGIYTTTSQDLTAVMQLFSLCYGFPSLPEKVISFDPGEWAMIMNTAWSSTDSTAHLVRTYPNVTDATVGMSNLVPILHPKGVDSPSTELLYTLFRPAAYSVDTTAGVTSTGNSASQVGLITNQLQAGDHGSVFGATNSLGGFLAVDEVGAGGPGNVLATSGAGLADAAPWLSLAVANVGAPTSLDSRMFREFDRLYVPRDQFVSETVYVVEKMFFNFK